MAKEIPYFKFYIGDWSNGDITLESFELQGIFINVCAYYWSKDCDVSVENVKKKFRMVSDCIDELIACSCIKVIGDNISISFLNEQYESREVQKAINRNNGSLGGRPRKEKTEEKPNGLFLENQNITNKEKRKEKKRKEEFIAPSLDEVCNYFESNGYMKSAGDSAHRYYQASDWKDRNGNQVKNWKLKMQQVWFRDEHKIIEEVRKMQY